MFNRFNLAVMRFLPPPDPPFYFSSNFRCLDQSKVTHDSSAEEKVMEEQSESESEGMGSHRVNTSVRWRGGSVSINA